MNRFFLFSLLVLFCYRVQRVFTLDDWPPTKRLRDYIEQRMGFDSAWFDFIGCPWCVGVYVCAGTVFILDRYFTPLSLPVIWAGALSAAVGLLARLDFYE